MAQSINHKVVMIKLIPVLNFVGGCLFAYNSLWFINSSMQENNISPSALTCSRDSNPCTPDMWKEKVRSYSAGANLGRESKLAALGAGLAFLRTGKREI